MKPLIIIIPLSLLNVSKSLTQEKITFPSKDGLTVTADLYKSHPSSSPFIVLFHQAGWSRGEYGEIAPKLNEMGFNCLAVDLRSGGGVNGIKNETNAAAKRANKGTDYLDTYQDIEAAIDYTKSNQVQGKILIWGSSYSSSLVLKYAGDNVGDLDGVLSFSPGEYFKSESKSYVVSSVKNISIPVFVTSSKNEKNSWENIFAAMPSSQKRSFLPKTKGNHGSKALWSKFADSNEYWEAVSSFLSQFLQ